VSGISPLHAKGQSGPESQQYTLINGGLSMTHPVADPVADSPRAFLSRVYENYAFRTLLWILAGAVVGAFVLPVLFALE